MRIIFLDFDGVLNRGHGEGVPELVARLNQITRQTGAQIVVHSSWRWERTVKMLETILRRWGVEGFVLDKCPSPDFKKLSNGIWVSDSNFESFKAGVESNSERCVAIQRWLNDHPEVTRYVILEDSSDMGLFQGKPEFIQTETQVGLTDSHVERAVQVLAG